MNETYEQMTTRHRLEQTDLRRRHLEERSTFLAARKRPESATAEQVESWAASLASRPTKGEVREKAREFRMRYSSLLEQLRMAGKEAYDAREGAPTTTATGRPAARVEQPLTEAQGVYGYHIWKYGLHHTCLECCPSGVPPSVPQWVIHDAEYRWNEGDKQTEG